MKTRPTRRNAASGAPASGCEDQVKFPRLPEDRRAAAESRTGRAGLDQRGAAAGDAGGLRRRRARRRHRCRLLSPAGRRAGRRRPGARRLRRRGRDRRPARHSPDAALSAARDPEAWQAAPAGAAIERVERYYTHERMFGRYREIYDKALARPMGPLMAGIGFELRKLLRRDTLRRPGAGLFLRRRHLLRPLGAVHPRHPADRHL